MPREATAANWSAGESFVARLAQFFPEASPIRVPVRVTFSGRGRTLSEPALLEYGTATEALFVSSLPLEFDDQVSLDNADHSLHAEGTVVAVQVHNGKTAIAVRFAHRVRNWVIQS